MSRPDWGVNEADLAFFAREIDSFLPRLFVTARQSR